MSSHVKFGAFMGPYHLPGTDPNHAIHADLKFVECLDDLGFAECWIGEHHSGAVEIVASPEIFVAAAAERTKRIKLGLGVVTLPYHHPFLVADRLVQLDHMTRGRVMFGAGPGQLAADSKMIGIDPLQNRRKMEESFGAIVRLLRGETVTEKTDWYTLDEAELQLRPYSSIEMATTATVSPNGPSLCGRYGTSLLSLAATHPEAITLLRRHWDIAETIAAENNQKVARENWRMVGIMHVADTEAQARQDVEHGLHDLLNYLAHVSPGSTEYDDLDLMIDDLNSSGFAVIGTPEMAVRQIRRLQEMSGGFGTYLCLHGDWANNAATIRSYELIASDVVPVFNGSAEHRQRQFDAVIAGDHATARVTAEAQAIAEEVFTESRKSK